MPASAPTAAGLLARGQAIYWRLCRIVSAGAEYPRLDTGDIRAAAKAARSRLALVLDELTRRARADA
jgi:hypothetical protein